MAISMYLLFKEGILGVPRSPVRKVSEYVLESLTDPTCCGTRLGQRGDLRQGAFTVYSGVAVVDWRVAERSLRRRSQPMADWAELREIPMVSASCW